MTPLQRHLPDARRWSRWAGSTRTATPIDHGFKTPEQGAATTVWAATSPQLDGLGGVYCEDCDIAEVNDAGRRRAAACGRGPSIPRRRARLWALSAELTGIDVIS